MKTNYFNFKSAALSFALFACVAGLNAQITLTYTYTGALQTFTIPSCVTNVTIDAKGAQGAINSTSTTTGGLGGAAYGILNVVRVMFFILQLAACLVSAAAGLAEFLPAQLPGVAMAGAHPISALTATRLRTV
jgi:hypothetical protein